MRYSVGTFIEKERSSVDKTPMELFQEQLGINKAQVAVEVVRLSHDKQKEAVREAFRHTVKANSRYLPSHLVAVRSDGGYTMMDYLGTKSTGESFYHCDTGIYTTEDSISDGAIPVVRCVENLPREDMVALLGPMESLTTGDDIPRVRIPSGFFVFTFTASERLRSCEAQHERVIRAHSLNEALQNPGGIFSGIRGHFIENIVLTTSQDSHWIKIFDRLSGREVRAIIGAPGHYRLSIE